MIIPAHPIINSKVLLFLNDNTVFASFLSHHFISPRLRI